MHHVTSPTEQQTLRMGTAKAAALAYAQAIDALIPDESPHKKIVMGKLRMVALVIDEIITHTNQKVLHDVTPEKS